MQAKDHRRTIGRYVLAVTLTLLIGLGVMVSSALAGLPNQSPVAGRQLPEMNPKSKIPPPDVKPKADQNPKSTALPTCTAGYVYASSTGSIVPGTTDTGNHGDDVATLITLPFPFSLYGTSYTTASVISNGNLQFETASTAFTNICLPAATHGAAIMPFWDDLRTNATGTCTGGCGVYTSISGTAPNRIFNIEWRTYYFTGTGNAYFEVRLYESGGRFDIVIGSLTTNNSGTIGVQNGALFTEYACNTAVGNSLRLAFTLQGCNTPTNTPTSTLSPTATHPPCAPHALGGSINADDPVQAGRLTRGAASTCRGQSTCPGVSDNNGRHYDEYYFTNNTTTTQCVRVLLDMTGCAGANVVSPSGNGLMDSTAYRATLATGSYRPNDLCSSYLADIGFTQSLTATYMFNVPAGDTFIIVVNEAVANQGCAHYDLTVNACVTVCSFTFTDVQPSHYFYQAVRNLYCRGVISGYADNTFRPYNDTTRGQLCKIIVLAEGWNISTPSTPTFSDVPADHPFYGYIETAFAHGVIAGYSCGTDCLEFRPGNNVTRGQLSKIIVLAQNWSVVNPPTPTFSDVPTDHPFYGYIETAYSYNIVSGYSCGTDCLEFRPGNNATRGQICKIVYQAVTQP